MVSGAVLGNFVVAKDASLARYVSYANQDNHSVEFFQSPLHCAGTTFQCFEQNTLFFCIDVAYYNGFIIAVEMKYILATISICS